MGVDPHKLSGGGCHFRSAATDLGWSVATSAGTRLASAGRAEGGRIGSVALPDNSFIDVVEVTGLVPRSETLAWTRLPPWRSWTSPRRMRGAASTSTPRTRTRARS